MNIFKYLFKRYEMPSKARLMGNWFVQGERGWNSQW